MYLLVTGFLLLTSQVVHSAEQTEHRDFQYNSVVDPMTGRYNFAYDTGNDNDIAHSLHMQYRDANGIVRGRYGYTDPHGKLRVVEYEAGPDGFVARGDVGPDQFPHDNAPETQVPKIARYSQEDLQLVPRPVQMAGWDPLQNPMGLPVSPGGDGSSSQGDYGVAAGTGGSGLDGYATTNNTNSEEVNADVPKVEPYDVRYPRISFSANENTDGRELESLSAQIPGDENKSEMAQDYPVAAPLTVNNIDVNPDDIRVAADQGTVGRSADGDRSRYSRALPYSYRNYQRQTHDHDAETQGTGYRVVYRPSHDHYNERYYRRPTHDHDAENKSANSRQTHDHDAERRYYVINRQTHDHDAERRYYVNNRQTHDHDAERRYYVSRRQTHDHDAERRYYVNNRQTHDHDAERANYNRRVYYRDYYPYRRRIYYKDSHSMVPHEHYSDIYHNDRSHQHSDVHLYGRSQNLEVPATTRPRQLKYIPSDKYHDKYYYWTD